jgi:hypothetical protein
MRRCGCIAVAVAERQPHDLGQCLHLYIGSLDRNLIGDEGVRDLGEALRVNTTLMTLMCEAGDVDVEAVWISDEAVWGAAVVVTQREPCDFDQCSHLHMGSLIGNRIRAAGALAALQVNTTLTTLQ